MSARAFIIDCAGPRLTADERALFRDADPWAFIVFKRHVEAPDQLRALTSELREAVGREALVFVDQEGGRVQRLGPPHWAARPPGSAFAALYARDPEAGAEAVALNYRLIGAELRAVGLDADCVPVLDVPHPGADPIIGDRAFGDGPDAVAALGRVALDALAASGVVGVIKHIPGHGRADADSHLALPRVEAPMDALDAIDFAPFRALSDAPMAMTAHVVYTAIDPDRAATVSPTVMGEVIRGRIGYDGLVMSDDLSMKALSGDLTARGEAAIAAGCDMLLHCNGTLEDARAVADAAPRLTGDAARRAEAAMAARRAPEAFDVDAAEARLADLLAQTAASGIA